MFSACILLYCILFYLNFLKMYFGGGHAVPQTTTKNVQNTSYKKSKGRRNIVDLKMTTTTTTTKN